MSVLGAGGRGTCPKRCSNFSCFLLAGSNSRETTIRYLSTSTSRFTGSGCSSLSLLNISAAPVWTGRDNGFVTKETHTAGRDNTTVDRPLGRTPEVICVPPSTARSLSESDISSISDSNPVQEAAYGRSYRMVGAQSRASFEDVPTTAHCPSCGTQVLTYTKYQNSNMTWALAGLLCAFGCHLGCCLAPFFFNSFKDVIHFCPLCMAQLGTYAKGR